MGRPRRPQVGRGAPSSGASAPAWVSDEAHSAQGSEAVAVAAAAEVGARSATAVMGGTDARVTYPAAGTINCS